MSVVGDRPVAPDALDHITAADRFWQRGDKALANLRLIFADLPRLATLSDAYRLSLATQLLDEGMAPDALTKELGLELATVALKYAPNQARIPAGHGMQSGQFTFGHEAAAGHAGRIVVAEEDDGPSENKDALRDQGSVVPLPHKGPPPPHPPLLQPGPPPVPVLPRVGGAGGEAPEKQPPHDQPPLLQPGPPPPNSQPLPPGIGPGRYASGWVPAVPGKGRTLLGNVP